MVDVARLAAVHRNTLTRTPSSSKVQARLGDVMRILSEATELLDGDIGKAVIWFRHQPLAGFEGQKADELAANGHADAVLTHLHMLQQGGYARVNVICRSARSASVYGASSRPAGPISC